MGYIIVGTIIGGIIWGIVVNKVIENKGYKEDWFWWGFFFGVFALIVALTKQSINTTKVVIESSAPIKENMDLLSSCILNNQVNLSSPVHIASWEIKKDAEKLLLFVDFINVSQKVISAVMFSAIGFNSFGDRVKMNDADFFDVIGQDLSIKPNEYGKVYITLQDDAIRKVEIKVKKICFADGTITDNIQDDWINTNQSELKSLHIDCVKRENAQSNYYAIVKEHYWQCVCGFVNTNNKCHLCGMEKDSAVQFAKNNIEDTYQKYLIKVEKEKQIEDERQKLLLMENEAKRKIFKRKTILLAITSTIIIVSIIFSNMQFEKNYKIACQFDAELKWEEAIEYYSKIPSFYKDVKEKIDIANHRNEKFSQIIGTWSADNGNYDFKVSLTQENGEIYVRIGLYSLYGKLEDDLTMRTERKSALREEFDSTVLVEFKDGILTETFYLKNGKTEVHKARKK